LEALSQGKKSKVRISHIGDSHIQADYLSHEARRLFQKTYGNGGRGFLFPYRLLRSNNPGNIGISATGNWDGCVSTSYRNACNFGICGASATTFDSSASLRLNPSRYGEMNYEFNRLSLFHYQFPRAFDLQFLQADSSLLDADVLRRSHSISSAYFLDYQDSLFLSFNKKDSQEYFQLFGVSFENDHPGVIYDAIGLNGAQVQTYLRNQFFEEQFAYLESDLIIISLGTNDGYMPASRFCNNCFLDNYRKFLRIIRKANPTASILLTTPGDFYRKRRYHDSHLVDIRNSIRQLAQEFDAALWDFNQIMGGSYAIKDWAKLGLAQGDLIHYTEKGYELQGRLLYQSIMEAVEQLYQPEIRPSKPQQ
jgi:lysophospholipase L1-like esterase